MRNALCFIFRSSFPISKSGLLKSHNFQRTPIKTLFSKETLRITSFNESRKNFNAVLDVTSFKTEMEKKCHKDSDLLIFFDDIQKLIKTVQSDDDLILLMNLMKKFSSQNNVIRFGSFSFGPEIMRLFYVLNKPKEALDLLKDEETSTLFSQTSSLTILGDLLFESKMYKEVIEFFHLVEDKQLQGKKFPTNIVILYFASCYKLNTPESFEEALNTWNLFKEVGFRSPMRGVLLFASLALKQNKYDFALKLVTDVKPSAISFNIEMMALSKEGQYEKALISLNKLLIKDKPNYRFSAFLAADTLNYIEKCFENSTEEHIKMFERLKKELLAHDFVKKELLDSFLLEEISFELKNISNMKKPQNRKYVSN